MLITAHIYLDGSQYAWLRDGRGRFHNPTSYLVEMCLSCNFFSDLRGEEGWTFGLLLTEASHQTFHIFTTRRYAKSCICRRRVSVCLSVCMSVTLRYCIKTATAGFQRNATNATHATQATQGPKNSQRKKIELVLFRTEATQVPTNQDTMLYEISEF